LVHKNLISALAAIFGVAAPDGNGMRQRSGRTFASSKRLLASSNRLCYYSFTTQSPEHAYKVTWHCWHGLQASNCTGLYWSTPTQYHHHR